MKGILFIYMVSTVRVICPCSSYIPLGNSSQVLSSRKVLQCCLALEWSEDWSQNVFRAYDDCLRYRAVWFHFFLHI